jgi:adenylate cyclase
VVNFQPTPHLVLQLETGPRYLPLASGNCWTVGRSEDNHFVLTDRWISRSHAMLQRMDNGQFYIIDLGSRNGTFVNGRRVSIPLTLQNGDRLTFGQTELQFFCQFRRKTGNSTELEEDEAVTATLHVRRLISVMVVDIRNFTVLTRQMDEQILSEAIGTWFRRSGQILRDHGSWVDKYIGDAVMAVWFHSTQKVSNQEVIQILQTLSALHLVTEDLSARYPLPFPLRIGAGVNTGYAMVGNTGSGDRPDYTALGDTVNAAFRLESSTKEIGADIAMGETTYQYIAALGVRPTPFQQYTVNLKGYDLPTLTYAGSFAGLDRFLPALPQGQ